MQKKVLFVASIEKHLATFHVPCMRIMKDRGYEIHTAAAGENMIDIADRHFDMPFTREPLTFANLKAYRALKKLIDENEYTFVHCHTPAASVLTRLAGRRARKKGTKIIYSAHGFHFYKGAPKRSAAIYYRVEKLMSRMTDAILLSNEEDYFSALKLNIKPQMVFRTNGVGCDTNRFSPVSPEERHRLRQENGFSDQDFIVLYPAELNPGKNHPVLIRAIYYLVDTIPEIKLLIAGSGPDEASLKTLTASLGLEEHVVFLGYRTDIEQFYRIADLDATPSLREGLGMHIVEALATGIPSVASQIRGHTEIIRDGVNGYYFDLTSPEDMAEKIQKIYQLLQRPDTRTALRKACIESARPFSIEHTSRDFAAIYDKILGDKT